MTLPSSYFFDLSSFSHSPLFEGNPYPWIALQRLTDYIQSLPLGEIKGTISPQAYLVHPELISIGEGTVVEAGAYIQGPCIIGKQCTIRHGAYIRGNILAGDRCVIGHTTEVKHSILLNNAHAAHFAYLGDSILGGGVNLGAGVKCANLRLDNAPITLHLSGQRISTGMRKFGAIIGDNTQIGCNVVSNPGTLIGQRVNCSPTLNIGGFIPSESTVKPAVKPVIRHLA